MLRRSGCVTLVEHEGLSSEQVPTDVVVTDLQQGLAMAIEAKVDESSQRHPRVLVLAFYVKDYPATVALECGVKGLISSSCNEQDLLRAVHRVSRDEVFLPPRMWERLSESRIWESLSPRESEVLQLIASGLSNKEIARALDIGEPTVKSHITTLMCKLGVKRRSEAAALALELGLVESHELSM